MRFGVVLLAVTFWACVPITGTAEEPITQKQLDEMTLRVLPLQYDRVTKLLESAQEQKKKLEERLKQETERIKSLEQLRIKLAKEFEQLQGKEAK